MIAARTTAPFIVVWALLVADCGPAVTVARDEARPEAPAVELPPLSEGACGGFAALELGAPVSVLHDRVRVPTLEGAAPPHWAREWTGALNSLRRELGERAFIAEASELYRTAPQGDLAPAVAMMRDNADATVVALEASEGGAQVIVFLPPPASEEDEAAEEEEEEEEEEEDPRNRLVPLLDAYVTTLDRSLVRVRFQVSPEAHAEGGCERIALRMAQATLRGAKQLDADGGDRALFGGLAVRVPASTMIQNEDLGHWVEHHVHVLSPLDEERTPFMMIRLDSHPGRPEVEAQTTMVSAPVFGRSAEWRTWVSDTGFHWRDVIVPGGPAGNVWVAIGADSPETVAQLGEIAASIGERAVDRARSGCERVARPPAAPALEPSPAIADALRTLQAAREVHTAAGRSAAPQPGAAFAAMRTLFRLPAGESAAAFRQVVEHGTPAGRVYGLVGLYYLAASDFDAIACASREALSTPISITDNCSARPHAGLELLESSEPAIAFTVHHLGAVDLRGGGLARRIYEQVFQTESGPLQGDGWVPALEPGGAAPPALAAGDAGAPRRIASSGYQLRWTTRDGRVAETDYGRTARYDEEWARFPVDEAAGRSARCVLDANGRRACGGSAVAEAFQEREYECGVAVPSVVPHRVFDDGPWADLVEADGVCGIRADDRSLHCFAPSYFQRISGTTAAPGLFGAFRMPIEGRVIGVFPGEVHSQPAFFASTEDGALYHWTLNDPPRVVHRFDSPVESVANVERVVFARLRDGRVFARGLRSTEEWWQPGTHEEGSGPFEEVEALRGARIFPDRRTACALDTEGRVRCWGSFMDGALGPVQYSYGAPAAEIPAYRGATELFVDSGMTCARMRGMQLVCAAEDIAERLPGRMRDGYLSIDLDTIRPAPPRTR